MGLTDDERKAIVAYRLEKATEAIRQVKGVLPLEYWEIIANRLYYAAYGLLRGKSFDVTENTPKREENYNDENRT